jgi:hypothetical protein
MNTFHENLRIQQCLVAFSAMLVSMQAWPGEVGKRGKPSAAPLSSPSMNRQGAGAPQFSQGQNAQLKVYGKTYGEWAVDWQQWAQAGPVGSNAMTDPDGRNCALNQPKRDVWFLAGVLDDLTGPKTATRKCTIPKDRALFYPLLSGGWIDCLPPSPDETVSDADIRGASAGSVDLACELRSTLDGVAISSLRVLTVRAQSRIFTGLLPPSNPVQVAVCPKPFAGGETRRQLAEGYWVMLPPLSPGKHTVTLHGAQCITGGFATDVTYDLTVHNRSW